MSNPVFSRLERQWQDTTPAGYPAMPGYTPGRADAPGDQSARYPYGVPGAQQAPGAGRQTRPAPPAYDQRALDQAEAAYRGPSADAVDQGRLTYDDVVIKTAILFAVLVAGAAASWWATLRDPALGMGLMLGGLLVGFVLAMVNSFSRTIRPALVVAYGAAEGVALGALSAVMESLYPGIVIQAVVATVAVFAVTLALFASKKVRNTPKLARFTLIALLGILAYRVLSMILSAVGFLPPAGFDGYTLLGMPLGVAVGVFAVLIGALCLIQDFDQARVGVERGVPRVFAWACAFGLMVTIVWMYVEILSLLARVQGSSN